MVSIQKRLKKLPKHRMSKKDVVAWLIAIPSIILFAFFIWGPLLQNIIFSFFKTSNFDIVSWNGFANYAGIFNDPRFSGALVNTLLYVGYSLLIGFLIPIILAVIISEIVRTKSVFKIGFYIPNIVPAIAVLLMWKTMMDANDYGFFNIILARLGLATSDWISNDTLSIPLIILTLTWKSAGATMLIYLATIQSIPNSLYEASRIKGTSVWQRLRYVTLPALFSNIKLLLIIQIISIFQIFYEPLVFMGQTNNAANTLGLLIYKLIYTDQNTGRAAALGVITMLILLAFTYVYLYFDRKTTKDRTKVKKYIPYEMMLKASIKHEKTFFYQSWLSFKKGLNTMSKGLSWLYHHVGFSWLMMQIGKGLNYIFKHTKQLGMWVFKDKNEGILTYSDYKKPSRRLGYYVMHLLLFVGLFIMLVPFFWLLFTSLKAPNEILQLPDSYHFFPSNWDFGKYLTVIKNTQIMRNVLNSVIIAFGAVVCSVLFNGLLAYVVSVLKPKGSKILFYLILGSMLIPPAVALVPLYKNINSIYQWMAIITGLNLRDIYSSVATLIPFWFIAGASPFNFMLFKSHFDHLPKDLFEMASLEGASQTKIFFKIVVPLSIPVIMVVSIFSVTAAWNDFLLPYIIINNEALWTVMVKLFRINTNMLAYGITLDQFLALLLFTMIPPIIIFFIFQKQITSNVATTGIK